MEAVSNAKWKTECGLDMVSAVKEFMIRKMSSSHKWTHDLFLETGP